MKIFLSACAALFIKTTTWPVSKPMESGWSACSDLAVTKAGTILCFYGRAKKPGSAGDRLTVARCNLEWLTDGQDRLDPIPAR